MSLYKVEAKSRRNSRKQAIPETDRLRRAQELLKEVDSLALLLEEVKRQSQRIQAAADAIGEEVFGDGYPEKTSESVSDGHARESSIGPKLIVRSRSAADSAGHTRNTVIS